MLEDLWSFFVLGDGLSVLLCYFMKRQQSYYTHFTKKDYRHLELITAKLGIFDPVSLASAPDF